MGDTDQTDVNRRPDGTFAPGNRASAGRSSRPAELRRALEAAVTVEDIQQLAKSLLRQANAGDTSAAKILFDRLIPKLSFEDELAKRLALAESEWLENFLYANSPQHRRERLGGFSSSESDGQSRLLEMLAIAEGVRDERKSNAES